MLAQRTHAPNLVVMFEAGGIAPLLPTMPVSVGDSTTFHKAVLATSMCDVMQFCQRGMVDYTFLSGAQIDPFGNLNSTVIGPALVCSVAFDMARRLAVPFAGQSGKRNSSRGGQPWTSRVTGGDDPAAYGHPASGSAVARRRMCAAPVM